MKSSGILLVNKQTHTNAFRLVSILRKKTGIQKIGHAGTLDPFATGVMVMLIGKKATQASNRFLLSDKEYEAIIELGSSTDTFDRTGKVQKISPHIPSLPQIEEALLSFQGEVLQTPPMYSAKKVQGKKLYTLARQGIEIERKQVAIRLKTTLISYEYPLLKLYIVCSKGTYIRSIAHDLGETLGTYGHLKELKRTRSGSFHLSECIPQEKLDDPTFNPLFHLKDI